MPTSLQFFLSCSAMIVLLISRNTVAFRTLAPPGRKLLKGQPLTFRRRRPSHLDVLAEPISTFLQPAADLVLDPLIVCGPSGVGKGTIITKFMEEFGGRDMFEFSVSHTTRAPRPGEIDGFHYHFVELETMKKAIEDGLFLEHAEVHGNYYGTSWASLRHIQQTSKRCILDIDVQGVKSIKRMESDALKPKYIFIAPPSLEILEERLKGRGTESAESIAWRTANARSEVEYGLKEENFDAIVTNQNLDDACAEFRQVVKELYNL